jgi:hypothetical protein
MSAPTVPWLFQVVGPVVWIAVAAFLLGDIFRKRRLSLLALVFFAATTMWWLEWYADWAARLLYNHKFALIDWGTTTWTAPNKPWAVIAGYGWFIGLSLPPLAALCNYVSRRRNGGQESVSFATALLVVLPIYWLFDVLVETVATALSWWRYFDPASPTVSTSHGGFPLAYPVLVFALWAVVAVWLLTQRNDRGFFLHERLLRVDRVRSAFAVQPARLGAMVLMLNVTYIVVLVLPICLIRALFGDSSSVVP